MTFATPNYQKSEVNRAGTILSKGLISIEEKDLNDYLWAHTVLANWRACHGYPINTFQAQLRKKLKQIDRKAIVAQRLKRTPSVIEKLRRFNTMKLSQIQDIAGLRAIVSNINRVRKLEENYRNSSFKHELVNLKDYINSPKADGYRSIHLVYKYKNVAAPAYNGLLIEIQIRTKIQHAWATAVETMSTFLGQALKTGSGDKPWREFFELASAALAHIEETTPLPGYESNSREDIFQRLSDAERKLQVLSKLKGFSIAASSINAEKGAGSYHLVTLDSSGRSVSIKPYPKSQLEEANKEYSRIEERAQNGEKIEAVLVAAGPIEALKKAYPNYFLDTHEFVSQMERIINTARLKKK
jgi:hypothetical protein